MKRGRATEQLVEEPAIRKGHMEVEGELPAAKDNASVQISIQASYLIYQ